MARQSRRLSNLAAPHEEPPRGSADPAAAGCSSCAQSQIASPRTVSSRTVSSRTVSSHRSAADPGCPGPLYLICGVLVLLFLRTRLVCLLLHLPHNSCNFRISRHNRHVSTPARVPRRSYAGVAATRAQLRSYAGGSPRRCSATRLKSIRDAQLLQKLAREWKVGRRDADRGVLQELCCRAAGQQGRRAAGPQPSRAAGQQGRRAAAQQGVGAGVRRELLSRVVRQSSRSRYAPVQRSPARSCRRYSPRRVCQPPPGCPPQPAARWRTAHPPPRATC